MSKMFGRRRGRARLAAAGFFVAGLVLALDQFTKHIILRVVDLDAGGPGSQIRVLDPVFNLTMVWNRGVSFGLLAADSLWQRLLLAGFSLLIAGVLTAWLTKAERWLQAVAFGLVIGGAIGNVIDRLVYGAVADFLDFSGLYFPYVFNVADAGISIGVALIVLDLLLDNGRPQSRPL
ncbi:signal peptidase II [Marinicauda sp. Alg238-R41]|uniref:signal peptidase II n=1 Tax=Marinicauda sp. Alg238-R41 TaxID=2993447 RepID=UPI0022E968A6|nr:signal peptidase II [Marinicauda sp. Alg238-R41]